MPFYCATALTGFTVLSFYRSYWFYHFSFARPYRFCNFTISPLLPLFQVSHFSIPPLLPGLPFYRFFRSTALTATPLTRFTILPCSRSTWRCRFDILPFCRPYRFYHISPCRLHVLPFYRFPISPLLPALPILPLYHSTTPAGFTIYHFTDITSFTIVPPARNWLPISPIRPSYRRYILGPASDLTGFFILRFYRNYRY